MKNPGLSTGVHSFQLSAERRTLEIHPAHAVARWVFHRKSSRRGFIFRLERCVIGNKAAKTLMQRRVLIWW